MIGQGDTIDEFDEAVVKLVGATRSGGRLERADFGKLRDNLGRLKVVAACGADVDDVISEALLRFTAACTSGLVHLSGNPSAYLVRTAQNVARSWLTTQQHPTAEFDEAMADASAADPFTSVELVGVVDAVMGSLAAARDTVGSRVFAALVDLTSQGELRPSVREVASYAGLSVGSTHRALGRIRLAVIEVRDE